MRPPVPENVQEELPASPKPNQKSCSSASNKEPKKPGKQRPHEVSRRWYGNITMQCLNAAENGERQTAGLKVYEASIIGSRAL